jgi:hypothetical protein
MQNAHEKVREMNGRNMYYKEDWIAVSEALPAVLLQTPVLLGRDALPLGDWFPKFRVIVSPSSSG